MAPSGDYDDEEGAPKILPASADLPPTLPTTAVPRANTGKPNTRIDPESRAALQTDYTFRCLYTTKLTLTSRQSRPVITWARGLVDTFCSALLKSMDWEAVTVDTRLLMLQVRRNHIVICFDLFLQKCDAQRRIEIDHSNKRPIHEISEKDGVYRVRRRKVMDEFVAKEFSRVRGLDKGERPYFVDILNPPVYENGVRLDGFQYGDGDTEDSDEPKEAYKFDVEHE